MKLARAALGRNPMQHTLLDGAAMPIFGEPVADAHLPHIAGQQTQVESILADGYWHTIPSLQKELRRRFGVLYAETSISARLRAMRKRGFTVTHERTRAGSNLYQYRAVKAEAHPC